MDKPQILRVRPVALASAGALVLSMSAAVAANAAIPQQPSASVANGILTILGTNGGDQITLGESADPRTLLVGFGNGTLPQAFSRDTFTTVSVFLRGGDDAFSMFANGVTLADLPVSVDGGAGDDTIQTGPAADTLIGGAGDDTLNGGSGNDLIQGGAGYDLVTGQSGNDTELLGAGDDTSVWNPGDGSDTVNGGGGEDTLTFNGSNAGENVSLQANGSHAVFTRDVAAIRMDLDGLETVDFAALGSADNVTIGDLRGTDVRTADVNLNAFGGGDDGAPDNVTVTGSNKADDVAVDAVDGTVSVSGLHTDVNVLGGQSTDHLQVNTLGGNDAVSVSDAAQAVMPVSVDLGTGQH